MSEHAPDGEWCAPCKTTHWRDERGVGTDHEVGSDAWHRARREEDEGKAPRPLQLLRNGQPLPDIVDTRASVSEVLANEDERAFRLDRLTPTELQRVLSSIDQMAQAQVVRFKAAGVVVFVFDSTGMSASVIARPGDAAAVTDEYILGALDQYVRNAIGAETPKRKKKR